MRIKTTIKYSLLHIIYFLVGFIPRNKKIWIFGSRNKSFSGNSKWLFLYLHKEVRLSNSNKTSIRKIWISRTKKIVNHLNAKGFEAYHLKSLKGIYYALRGGIYIFNVNTNYDINYFLSNGAKKINLWHGIGGIKKIGFDCDLKNDYFYKLYHGNLKQKIHYHFFSPWEYEKYDAFICASENTMKFIKSQISGKSGKRIKNAIIAGYSRNDVLLKNINSYSEEDQKLINVFKTIKSSQKKIIFYMPTFRDTELHKSDSMDIPIDWKKFNSFLEKNNSVLFLKLHPVKAASVRIPDFCKNIQSLDSLPDIYPVLKYVDILITDYSTICYDFLLCLKPIIFFWYDLEKYKTTDRSIYEFFENLLIGPRVKTFNALLDVLDNCINNKNNFIKENLKQLNNCRNIIHKYTDSNSSKRIYEQIINKFVK